MSEVWNKVYESDSTGVKGKSVTIHPEKYQLDLDKYRSE
jgi:hypothetical protein